MDDPIDISAPVPFSVLPSIARAREKKAREIARGKERVAKRREADKAKFALVREEAKQAAEAEIPISRFAERKCLNEKSGEPTGIALPFVEPTREQYQRDIKSNHIGIRAFVKQRGFETLKVALCNNGSRRALNFLAALMNPKYKESDIPRLAEKYGIGYGELMAIWRNDRLAEAVANLFDAAPTIAAHTARDAESTRTCCPRCDGSGRMKITRDDETSWVDCVSCDGTGAIRKIGDKDSRRFVFEGTGIVKTGGGVNVNINASAVTSVDSILDEMEQAIPATFEASE